MIAGRYELEHEIGRGGMGAVWLARDTVLGRHVAVKRVGLMPGGSSPDLLRAEREAKLAARLNHPHVVAVFDLVEEGDGRWLVMEYVDGVTLSELVRQQGPLPPDRAAALLRQVAEALASAHAADIVHRDVKPSNILVAGGDTAKLSDFGIARAVADSSLTQTGMVTGSPAYLAPEVASGKTATPASDVWSLGATLFHALSGHPPYDVGDNVLGALYRIVHEEPPRLEDAGWLGPLLEATMTVEPSRRWSMQQVRDHLAAGGQPAPGTVPEATTDAAARSRAAATTPPELDEDRTEVLRPGRTRVEPARGRRLPVRALFGGTAAAVLAVVLLVWLLPGDGGNESPGAGGAAPTTSAPGPGSDADTPAATAEGMEEFVESYLDTVTENPRAAWDMLTPAFQEASGGYGSYRGFWSRFERAQLRDISADPQSLTVTYEVRYHPRRGDPTEDRVTLQLVRQDGGYLIAAEPSA